MVTSGGGRCALPTTPGRGDGSPAVDREGPGRAERLELVDAEALGPHGHHLALVVAGQDRDLEAQGVAGLAGIGVDDEHVVGAVGEHARHRTRPGRRETREVTGTTGRLLVAEPMLGDPNFDRTVVLMLQHTAEGALGLVLNRPTDVPVADALPGLGRRGHRPGRAPRRRSGGGAERLVPGPGPRRRRCSRASCPWSATSACVDLELDPAHVATAFHAVRLYAGYSGWGPGQLEHELAQDAWFVADAEPDDPFLPDGRRPVDADPRPPGRPARPPGALPARPQPELTAPARLEVGR